MAKGAGTSTATRFPAAVDTIIIGAGTAGAVVAGRLAAGSPERTLLLEAGPDYGPAGSGRWPHDLLDAAKVAPESHDWGYTGEFAGRMIRFRRARVVGGCSAHTAGAVVFGSRFDYDGWAAAGNAGWSARDLLPLFASAWKQLRVRRVGLDELTPFQRVCRDAIVASGIPAVEDFNDLGQNAGVAPFPVNIDGVIRVNSAFGYVDPVRDRLMVAGDAPVERVLVRAGRAAGVAVRDGQRLAEIGASRVVLSAGAYGSPAILLRSGIGPAGELSAIGVRPTLDLPGVGRNLHDQPCVEVWYEGSGELAGAMERHQAETGWRPDEQVIAKFPSAGCRQGFDLHIYPVGGYSKDASAWGWFLGVACLTPLSRGSVRLTGPGPGDRLVIDHRYLSDPAGYDRARLAEGLGRVREVAQAPELRGLLGRETRPGPEVSGRQAVERYLDHAAVHYYHPAGTCKMGPASDPESVAGCCGRVHGIEGLYVADASLMPAVISGNTNMPTTVIGERIARSLLGLPRRLAGSRGWPRQKPIAGGATRCHDDAHARCPPPPGRGPSRRHSHHPGPSGLLHRRCARQGRTRRRQPRGLGRHRLGSGSRFRRGRQEITGRRGNPVDRRRREPARPRPRNQAAGPCPGPPGRRRDQRR
jgi:choline dehydrogenase